MTAPIAIEAIEEALSAWLSASTGAAVYFVEPRDSGAPKPPTPAVQIVGPSAIVAIGQPEQRPVPSIMQQRVTVTAAGAGQTGVDFRLGFESEPTPIIATMLGGDDEAAGATKLLAELAANLPAGVTASADPEDPASIIVDGSAGEPLFSTWPTDEARAEVETLLERVPKIEASWSRMTWTMDFRATPTRGFGSALDLMTRARVTLKRKLMPSLRAAGMKYGGTLFADTIPGDRNETAAQLALSLQGYATAAFQSPAARQVGLSLTT